MLVGPERKVGGESMAKPQQGRRTQENCSCHESGGYDVRHDQACSTAELEAAQETAPSAARRANLTDPVNSCNDAPRAAHLVERVCEVVKAGAEVVAHLNKVEEVAENAFRLYSIANAVASTVVRVEC